jgi:hypothetical protein
VCRLAKHEADFARRDVGLGSFLHPKGDNAQGAQRPGNARDSESGGFDANVIRAGGTAADSHAAALLDPPVVGGPAGHGVGEVVLPG